jgi:hypothetical protein
MEVHYETNGAFLEEGQLLKSENIAKIRHIPCKSQPRLTSGTDTDDEQAA